MCVCVCLSVCPTQNIRNARSYHHAAYTILKRFTWRVAQTAFLAYSMSGSREIALKFFCQLHSKSCACTITLPVTLNRMILAHYKKTVLTFSKNMCWRTCPPHHGESYKCSCYCFFCESAIDTPREQVKGILPSMNKKTNLFMNVLQLVHNNTRILCVCLSVCVFVPPKISRMGGRITTLLTPSWRASPGELHKLLFLPTRRAVREKNLWRFFTSYSPNPVHTPLYFWLRWAGWIFPTTRKPLEPFQRVRIEGHTLHITCNIVPIAFYVNGL